MTFEQAERSYVNLVQQMNSRQITPEQFQNAVSQLRIKTADGAWWQIDPNTGGWLRWDGASWVSVQRPVSPAPPPPPSSPAYMTPGVAAATVRPAQKKKSVFERFFFWLIFRAFLFVLTFVSAWILHTFLLVYTNNGFGPENPIGNWINVTGHESSSFTIWMFASGIFWSFVIACFQVGPVKTIVSLVSSPFRFIGAQAKAGTVSLGAMAVGAGIALMITGRIHLNYQADLTAFISWGFMSMGYPGMMVAEMITRAVKSVTKTSPVEAAFGFHSAHALVVSVLIGFLLNSFIKGGWAIAFGIILFIAGVIIWIKPWKPGTRRTDLAIFILLGAAFALLYALVDLIIGHAARADDGGWIEFRNNNPNGTLADYLRDPASQRAFAHGVTPAAASGIGALAPPIAGAPPASMPQDLSGADIERIREALRSHFESGGKLPENFVVTAGFGGGKTWTIWGNKDWQDALRSMGIEPNDVNPAELLRSGDWGRAAIVGLAAGGFMALAGLTWPWVVATGGAAALWSKYGPDPAGILDIIYTSERK